MNTQQISRKQWKPFLDDFSQQHAGRIVSVESIGKKFGVQANARNLPLIGLTAESHADGAIEIQIIVGDSPAAYIAHVIRHPTALRSAEENGRGVMALQIESQEGVTTLLQITAQDAPEAAEMKMGLA